MMRGLCTVSFWAADLDAAKAWYSELFGCEPYFTRPGYIEFRIGDQQDELGIIDAAYAPAGAREAQPGGAVVHWAVDDLAGGYDRLLAHGAKEYQPPTAHGDAGFATASVVDPFGNVLGIMSNPHYMDMLGRTAR